MTKKYIKICTVPTVHGNETKIFAKTKTWTQNYRRSFVIRRFNEKNTKISVAHRKITANRRIRTTTVTTRRRRVLRQTVINKTVTLHRRIPAVGMDLKQRPWFQVQQIWTAFSVLVAQMRPFNNRIVLRRIIWPHCLNEY